MISVIFPVFNESPFLLDKSLLSIITQTYKNIEILILDDHSENLETLKYLKEIQSKDTRIKVLRWGKNLGLTKSLNQGISFASGSYILRHDADDWSELNRIESQFKFLQQHPDIHLVGSNVMLHSELGKPLWASNLPTDHFNICKFFKKGNPFAHGSVMFKKNTFDKLGGYNPNLIQSQDYDLFWRFSEYSKVANLSEAYYHLRKHKNSVSNHFSQGQYVSFKSIQIVAKMRKNGLNGDYKRIIPSVKYNLTEADKINIDCKLADEYLLSGDYIKSILIYTRILGNTKLLFGGLKLVRAILYITFPIFRKFMFR